MTIRIALLSPRLDTGDAVGADVAGMAAALRARGADVRLFAEGWNMPGGVYHVRHIRSFLKNEADVLIYHYSIAWNTGLELFRTLRCRRVLRYHNITPPEFFDPYHPGIANNCRAGLEMLPQFLATEPDLILTPSTFNRADLVRAGAVDEKTHTLPCFHRAEELLIQPANRYALLQPKTDMLTVLTVGRIVPNKAYEDLFQELALLAPEMKGMIRVVCVGKKVPGLSRYTRRLNEILDETGMRKQTRFFGPVTEGVLKSWYLKADVLVSASRHEGFCVPLVEAMALRVPILARGYAAVPETIGAGRGLVETRKGDLAASVSALFNAKVRNTAADPGYLEYQTRFSPHVISDSFLLLMRSSLKEAVP